MKKTAILLTLLLSSCNSTNISDNLESIQFDSHLQSDDTTLSTSENTHNNIEDIIPLTINLKVGELYDITIEEDIEVILSNDNVFYNETHKDLIALEEGYTNVEIYLKDNPNIKTYLEINITNEDVWLSDVPDELFLTVGETIHYDIPNDPNGYQFYLEPVYIPINIEVEVEKDQTNNRIYNITGLYEGCTKLIIYRRNIVSPSDNDFLEKTIKIFVNNPNKDYSNKSFYESYAYNRILGQDYFNLNEFDLIKSKKELFELYNYCLFYDRIPSKLLNLDFNKFSILTMKRVYSSPFSIKKYYGFEIVDNNIYIYQKNYGDKLQDDYYEIDLLIIDNELLPNNFNFNINNYDIKIVQLDKMISAGEWNNDKRTFLKFFLFFYNNTI